MKLTEKEEKITRLALDAGAKDGERASAALKLIESLRARGVTVEDLQSNTPVIAQGSFWGTAWGLTEDEVAERGEMTGAQEAYYRQQAPVYRPAEGMTKDEMVKYARIAQETQEAQEVEARAEHKKRMAEMFTIKNLLRSLVSFLTP